MWYSYPPPLPSLSRRLQFSLRAFRATFVRLVGTPGRSFSARAEEVNHFFMMTQVLIRCWLSAPLNGDYGRYGSDTENRLFCIMGWPLLSYQIISVTCVDTPNATDFVSRQVASLAHFPHGPSRQSLSLCNFFGGQPIRLHDLVWPNP